MTDQQLTKLLFASLLILTGTVQSALAQSASYGPRPFYLVDNMDDGPLKEKLTSCASNEASKSDWSIAHRGAPLQFPEHTAESYAAAARMGAGIVECDVTFTKDRQLVCRHAQNDLHTTTDILTSDLASTCITPFEAATGESEAKAECRTSELTLAEFRTLNGKMDAANKKAVTAGEYVDGTAKWRTDLYSTKGTVLTHKDYIQLVSSLGAKFTPELKSPTVEMPFDGDYTQQAYAQQMIDEYREAGVDPSLVYPQSFNLGDVLYWIENEPEFGKQAVFLDASYNEQGWSPMDAATWLRSMEELKTAGVNYVAPPMWVLVTNQGGKLAPSLYATEAKAAGLEIITWTVERSGPLASGGGWYYQSIASLIDNDGDVFNLLHVLNQEVGIAGMFSDWPATTTYYANCFGLK